MTTAQRFPHHLSGLCAALAAAGLMATQPAAAQQTPADKADEDRAQTVADASSHTKRW